MNLKVCGLKDPQNIKNVAKLNPDYMGFIFFEGSKRFVGEDFILPAIPSEIKKTGVFVNAKADYIIDKIDKYKLDCIQLHGNEKPDFCEVISHFITVIKAFGVDEKFDFGSLKSYENCCHYFLFDTKTNDYGGSGKQFDWEILGKYNNQLPFFLSGGIGLEEIEKLQTEKLKIHGIDVNSKFETEPGIKNIQKLQIARFQIK